MWEDQNLKKQIFAVVLLTALLCSGCAAKEPEELKAERTQLQSEIKTLKSQRNELVASRDQLLLEVVNLKHKADGETAMYMLTLELKQSHFTLDIGQHVKDSANAVEFTIPVDKAFYDSQNIGNLLVDDFRTGSFLINGSIGNWKVKVTNKQTIWAK